MDTSVKLEILPPLKENDDFEKTIDEVLETKKIENKEKEGNSSP